MKKYLSRGREDIEMTCLNSALEILSIFPNLPDRSWACYVPWWNVLYFLVQATAVLLISISLESLPLERWGSQNSTGDSSAG
jgi:hypothetical protein